MGLCSRITWIIRKAPRAANSGHAVADHFVDINEMVSIGSGAQRPIEDWALSRYGCYLVIQNADPGKPLVALGQSYFAVQTRHLRSTILDLRSTIYDFGFTIWESAFVELRRDKEGKRRRQLRKPPVSFEAFGLVFLSRLDVGA